MWAQDPRSAQDMSTSSKKCTPATYSSTYPKDSKNVIGPPPRSPGYVCNDLSTFEDPIISRYEVEGPKLFSWTRRFSLRLLRKKLQSENHQGQFSGKKVVSLSNRKGKCGKTEGSIMKREVTPFPLKDNIWTCPFLGAEAAELNDDAVEKFISKVITGDIFFYVSMFLVTVEKCQTISNR